MQHRARKRFGQNFLVDSQVIQRIADVISPQPDQLLIEIGPGQAALTGPLLASGAELLLVEIDRDLAGRLQSKFSNQERLHVHQADALRVDFHELSGGRPFRLVGNLPYNISTPLLFHVLRWSDLIIDMHFMLQQEVVNRMVAVPGNKQWGRLSVKCQYHCAVSSLFNVPPEAFSPAPRVQSAIVRLVPHRAAPVTINDMETFDRLLTQVFSMRRKTLRNGLRGLIDAGTIESLGIDPGLRPEMLTLEQFAILAESLSQQDNAARIP